MRLLIATPLYPPEPGGPATYARLLELELPKRGIDVKIVKFSDVRGYPKFLRHIAYTAKLLNAAQGSDVLLVQDTVSCGVPAAITAMLTKIPLVVRVPGDYAWEQGVQRFGVHSNIDIFQRERGSWQVRFLRALQRFTVRHGYRVIVPSLYFKSVVSAWGAAPGRIRAIYHGMHELHEKKHASSFSESTVLISIGRLVPWKGFPMLLEILSELPECSLVIIGSGPERERLEEKALAMGVSDRVRFTGGLPHEGVMDELARADFFVLNTSFESFSFQILEAMAVGIPIIATNAGSIPELIQSGREGILCTPDDAAAFTAAITALRKDPAQAQALGDAAYVKAKEFSVERMIQSTILVLHEAIDAV